MTEAAADRPASGAGAALALVDVSAGYGETVVLESVTLALEPGQSLSVLGRNGVGKSTLLATIMGHTTLHLGSVHFHGRDVSRWAVHRRARAGMGYVPQEREVFPSLTVRENLTIGARPGRFGLAEVFALFPRLAERQGHRGNQLSGGEQQMLSIARALMTNPVLLLMDEPTEGLAPLLVEELVRVMTDLRSHHGLGIVLVEQNAAVALAFSERAVVMDRGQVVYDGASAGLAADPARLAALIGVGGG